MQFFKVPRSIPKLFWCFLRSWILLSPRFPSRRSPCCLWKSNWCEFLPKIRGRCWQMIGAGRLSWTRKYSKPRSWTAQRKPSQHSWQFQFEWFQEFFRGKGRNSREEGYDLSKRRPFYSFLLRWHRLASGHSQCSRLWAALPELPTIWCRILESYWWKAGREDGRPRSLCGILVCEGWECFRRKIWRNWWQFRQQHCFSMPVYEANWVLSTSLNMIDLYLLLRGRLPTDARDRTGYRWQSRFRKVYFCFSEIGMDLRVVKIFVVE